MSESTDDLIRAIISTKEKKVKEHDEIAARALETYKKHVHASGVLKAEIQGLRESIDA